MTVLPREFPATVRVYHNAPSRRERVSLLVPETAGGAWLPRSSTAGAGGEGLPLD